jgi:stage V sporulation protein B
LAVLLGIGSAVLLYFSAGLCAEHWLHDPRAAQPLRILAFSIPACALSAALGGYCNAAGAALPYAAAQLLEQGFKILLTLFAMNNLPQIGFFFGIDSSGSEAVCIAMAIGITVAEWISLCMSLGVYGMWGKRLKRTHGKKTSLRALMRIALPDGLGASARGILLTAEHLLIPPGLRKSGAGSEEALAAYGTIHGMTLPLLLYPSAILSSLTGLLIPEIARLRSQGHRRRITDVSSRLIHLTLCFSIGAAAVFYAFAPQLSAAIYGDTDSADSIRLLSPLVPAMFLDMTIDGLLKGLDEQRSVMNYNILDSALCVIMVLLVLPPFGVKGYYIILYAAELINLALSANRLLSVSDAHLSLRESIIKCILCAGAAWGVTRMLFVRAAAGMSPLFGAVLLIFWMTLLYFVFLNTISRKGNRLTDLLFGPDALSGVYRLRKNNIH